MSTELGFIDTSVLVYLFDRDSPAKQAAARELVSAGRLVLSSQVLSEFYVTVTRKLTQPLAPAQAARAVADLSALPVRDITSKLVRAAIGRSAAAQLSYWDALIVESALESGATILLTEDLQHGQVIDRLRVQNPFRAG